MSDTKRRGRPPLDVDNRSVPISFKMPSKQLRDLEQQAQRERMTVPDYIRRAIRRDARSGSDE